MTTHGIPGKGKVPETGRVYLNCKHLQKVSLVVDGENFHFSLLKSLVHKGARAGELGGCVCAHELLLEAGASVVGLRFAAGGALRRRRGPGACAAARGGTCHRR